MVQSQRKPASRCLFSLSKRCSQWCEYCILISESNSILVLKKQEREYISTTKFSSNFSPKPLVNRETQNPNKNKVCSHFTSPENSYQANTNKNAEGIKSLPKFLFHLGQLTQSFGHVNKWRCVKTFPQSEKKAPQNFTLLHRKESDTTERLKSTSVEPSVSISVGTRKLREKNKQTTKKWFLGTNGQRTWYEFFKIFSTASLPFD